jgi:N-acetyl-gamma-glutamylphosphate reductase
MVAAWIKAETGVGPSIAIGNQTCNPTCELLAIAPINKHTPTKIITLSL